jgi:hypothetical protein
MSTTPQPQAPAEGVLTLEQALRRAFCLGQTYWQQADSESYSQNRKSDETRQKFEALVSSILSTPAGQAPAPAHEPEACQHDWRDFYAGPNRTHLICAKCEKRVATSQPAQEPAPAAAAPKSKPRKVTLGKIRANLEGLSKDELLSIATALVYEAQEPDATRYRWLRKKVCIVGSPATFHILNLPSPTYVAPDAAVEFDAAIDAARQEQKRTAKSNELSERGAHGEVHPNR